MGNPWPDDDHDDAEDADDAEDTDDADDADDADDDDDKWVEAEVVLPPFIGRVSA